MTYNLIITRDDVQLDFTRDDVQLDFTRNDVQLDFTRNDVQLDFTRDDVQLDYYSIFIRHPGQAGPAAQLPGPPVAGLAP